MQSTLLSKQDERLHVGVIMDGNGRWAQARGKARIAGHRAGAASVRRVVEAAPKYGIGMLTLYAFSSDNWKRPAEEVAALMRLLMVYLRAERERCIRNGVRVSVIGRRDRLAPAVVAAISEVEQATAAGETLHLRIAIDYSARDAMLRAMERLQGKVSREEFTKLLGEYGNGDGTARDLDLVIRTSGEQRLSDFLLWEAAYAEFYFTRRHWPDFDEQDLAEAIAEFHRRERRFGKVSEAKAV